MPDDRLREEIEIYTVAKAGSLVMDALRHRDTITGFIADDVEDTTAKLAHALVLQGDIESFKQATNEEELFKAACIGKAMLHVVDRELKTVPAQPLVMDAHFSDLANGPVYDWSRNPDRGELETMAHLLSAPQGLPLDKAVMVALSLENLEVLAEQNKAQFIDGEISSEKLTLLQQYMERSKTKDMDIAAFESTCGNYLFQLMFESCAPTKRDQLVNFDDTTVSICVVNQSSGHFGMFRIDRQNPEDTNGLHDAELDKALDDFLRSKTTHRIRESDFEEVYLDCIRDEQKSFIRVAGKRYNF
ncbi:MAG: hypothetical protein QFB86_03515 [Patescibacteria group bacterium]|nr:hypothetical protein [Patescibacteria group bacterium]